MSRNIHADRVLILDFGSQYTQLIARRVREAGVYSEIYPYDVDDAAIRDFAPRGIILSGGPESVTEGDTPRASQLVFELGVPVLGICYGMQTMAAQLGGAVEGSETSEFGYAQIRIEADSPLFHDIRDHVGSDGASLLDVWMSHGDKVTVLPDDFHCIASTATCPIAAMAHANGVPFIVDNTVATPALLNSIDFGADFVVHSMTKYMGGHGTTLGGIIVDAGTFPWAGHAERYPTLNQPEPAYHGVCIPRPLARPRLSVARGPFPCVIPVRHCLR